MLSIEIRVELTDIQDKIHSILITQEESRFVREDSTEKYTVDEEKLQNCLQDTKERLTVKLKTGVCSDLLIYQIARHRCGIGEVFRLANGPCEAKVEYYNASELCDLIEYLEQGRVIGRPFNRSRELKGFSKVHHSLYAIKGYSTIRNVKEYWYRGKKIKKEREENFSEILQKYDATNIAAIVNEMHYRALREKWKRGEVKGEWLIYAMIDNRKYYLCLAAHKEGDKNIFDNKLKKCLMQFPELNRVVSKC